jgi:hypothetical protein
MKNCPACQASKSKSTKDIIAVLSATDLTEFCARCRIGLTVFRLQRRIRFWLAVIYMRLASRIHVKVSKYGSTKRTYPMSK